MGRLKTMPARLGAAPRRMASAAAPASDKPADHPPSAPATSARPHWKRWYHLARWKRLRREVIREAEYICAQTGVILMDGGRGPNAAVVDHITPHKGDPVLFWDKRNLQAVAKSWHDSDKQRIERAEEVR